MGFITTNSGPAEDRGAITRLLKSESAELVYTACEKLCLGYVNEAEELFKRTMRVALGRMGKNAAIPEAELFKILNVEWGKFAAQNAQLGANNSKINFDWNHLDLRQGEDALLLLNPKEREIFIYRFLLKFSAADIARMTELSEPEIAEIFHNAIGKVITA